MSDKREVTVYDRTEAKASVGLVQIHAYMKRAGWHCQWKNSSDGYSSFGWSHPTHGSLTTSKAARHWHEDVSNLAEIEKRKPSEVLADIAKDPA